jgi:hypothetical protein
MSLRELRHKALGRSLIPPSRLQFSEWIEANIKLPEGVRALPGAGPSVGASARSCRRLVLFVGPAHDDPERVVRQWPLQRLGFIPRCAHQNVSLFIGRQDFDSHSGLNASLIG